MDSIRSVAIAVALVAGTPASAAQDTQHQAHHPATSNAAAVKAVEPARGMPDMDAQMKDMQAMHARMMAAKTPAERKALMAEHMAVMQRGMKMMHAMPPGGGNAMNCNMGEQHQHMEMEMMQSMMQMMMDRMGGPAPE